MIAIITPWRDAFHLLDAYDVATRGATPIIVDNSANADTSGWLATFTSRRGGGVYLRDTTTPFSYARACNAGLRRARDLGASHAVCLNNDIEGDPAWLADVATLPDGVLAGPELLQLVTAGQPHLYVAGWCVAATMATWEHIGWWDDTSFVGCYHEDVDLSWRAARAGVYLQRRAWGLRHLGEQTSRVTPGATDNHAHNRRVFAERVRAWKGTER